MELLKGLQRTALLAALAIFAFAAPPAFAQIVPTPATACVGADGGNDCTAVLGHISVSVAGTLSINEERAISFGNISVACAADDCTGGANMVLGIDASRTVNNAGGDVITALFGADNGGAAGPPDSGAQAPGRYAVTGAGEGTANDTGVYISFADNAGNPVDHSGEDYWTANDDNIQVVGTGGQFFTVNDFVFNEDGDDVYGHYINTTTNGATDSVDVIVGATLHTDNAATTYAPGRYIGTYIVMVSY